MKIRTAALWCFTFLVSCATTGNVPVESGNSPGWVRSETPAGPLPQATTWDGNNLVFILPAQSGWSSAQVLSPLWQAPLTLDLVDGRFAAAVVLSDPEGFEYVFSVKTGESTPAQRLLDPVNRAVVWKKPLWSVYHKPDTTAGVVLYMEEKRYLVMLPPGYYSQIEKRYPVMYWHDGQNMPAGAKSPMGGWKADTTLARLLEAGEVEPVIQVGIFNSGDRMTEYTAWAWPVPEDLKGSFKITEAQRDKSLALVRQITDTLIPEVETSFRTLPGRENRGIGGSSAGAMFALYMAFAHPQTFGKVAAVAGGQAPYGALRQRLFRPDLNLKIYLDCGTEGIDRELLPETLLMGEFLQQKGYQLGENLFYQVFQGTHHNEKAWAERLPGMLRFLFPKSSE